MAKPSLPQFDPHYDVYKMRQLVDEINRWVETVELGSSGAGGGGTPGVTVHNSLSGRAAPDAHPIAAISGLQAALDGKASIVSLTALSVRVTTNEENLDRARVNMYFLGE